MQKRTFLKLLAGAVLPLSSVWGARAAPKTRIVGMTSIGREKIFQPDYLEASVGDTIRFVNVKGNHNTESIEGMIPEGVEPWKSEIRETFDLTITHEGVYGYKCTPHYAQKMVGLIVVGNPNTNLDTAKSAKMPKVVRKVFDKLFARISEAG